MLNQMKCEYHSGCLYDVLCKCNNCDYFSREINFNIWRRFAYLLTQKALFTNNLFVKLKYF